MTNLTPQQSDAAVKLKEAHEQFVAADKALTEDGELVQMTHVLEYLVTRNLLREATENAERAFAPLMP